MSLIRRLVGINARSRELGYPELYLIGRIAKTIRSIR